MTLRRLLFLLTIPAALLLAQDWKTMDTPNGVDLSGLTPTQKSTVLKLIRERDCGCGCSMKVAECRLKDPGCGFSTGLAATIVASIKSGHTPEEALAAAKASKFDHAPEADGRILGDKQDIPIGDAAATGSAMAKLTIVEYSDFQCPFCVAATPEIQAFLKAHPGDVRLVFKEFPLESHSQAAIAALAALAAQKQGKFWEMHDAIFAAKGHFTRPTLMTLASMLGLDRKKFEADLASEALANAVNRDVQEGIKLGVEGTPTIFLNGRRFNTSITLASLNAVLKNEPSLLAQSAGK